MGQYDGVRWDGVRWNAVETFRISKWLELVDNAIDCPINNRTTENTIDQLNMQLVIAGHAMNSQVIIIKNRLMSLNSRFIVINRFVDSQKIAEFLLKTRQQTHATSQSQRDEDWPVGWCAVGFPGDFREMGMGGWLAKNGNSQPNNAILRATLFATVHFQLLAVAIWGA